jgi:NAD(P)-dependent dehydrogenase (short-subunit alcohol dehydrogenase family)
MTAQTPEWIYRSEIDPSVFEILGPSAVVTDRCYRSAEGGSLDPKRVALGKPFVVAITGSGKGIGSSIAFAYAQAGASGILLSSRTATDLEKVADKIKAINVECQVHFEVCDVACEEDIERLAFECKQKFGRLDVIVINAGVVSQFVTDGDGHRRFPRGILEDTSADFSRVWNTNFKGAYHTARAFLPLLQNTTSGAKSIIFISSLGSQLPDSSVTSVAHNISKLAVNRLMEYIHEDYHSDGVLAYAVHPGGIQTNNSDFPSEWDKCTYESAVVFCLCLTAALVFADDPSLPGGFCVWLTKTRRDWLSGRFICANWDVNELEMNKEQILAEDKYKSRLLM